MKKLLFVLFAVMGILFFSACQQDDLAPEVSDADIIAKFNATHGDDTPSDSLILAFFNSTKENVKSASVEPDPIIGLIKPLNNVYPLPGGGVKQVWAWVILKYGQTKDHGIIVAQYGNDQKLKKWEFYIGWEDNEYCNPVNIKTSTKNAQIKLVFSFSVVGGGNLNYKTFFYGENFDVWLPALDYSLNWEIMTESHFGGLISFNSLRDKNLEIVVGMGIEVNTFDYLVLNMKEIGVTFSNSKVIVNIFDQNSSYIDQTELIFPMGRMIPVEMKIPLTFKPKAIEYQIVTYPKDMAKYSDWKYIKCMLSEDTGSLRTYRLEY